MLRIVVKLLIHSTFVGGAGFLIWHLTAAWPMRARWAFLAAFALGVLHAQLRRRISSSETVQPSDR